MSYFCRTRQSPRATIESFESRRLLSVAPAVASLTLINADDGKAVPGFATIANGAVIDLDLLPTTHLNVRANPRSAALGSIKFGYDTNTNFHVESLAPYALFGDGAAGYVRGSFALGTHTITATPYSGAKATGTAGAALTIHIQVTRRNTWISGHALPVVVAEVAGGIIGHTMYLVGEGSSSTFAYDLLNNTWKTVAPRPFVGDHHAAEVINAKLYLFGGIDGGSPGKVQIYDPVVNKWSLGTSMPFAAGSCSSAVIGGKVYVAGGIIGTSTTSQAAVYDPVANSWKTIASMPFGLNHSAAATDGHKLYIFGGRTGGNTVTNGFATVEVYDPTTNTWQSSDDPSSHLAPLPQARGGMGKAVYANGEFYVMGGETKTGAGATSNFVYNRVDIYNPLTNTWTSGAPMPTARHGIFPLLYGNEIYVAGGGTHSGFSFSNVLQIYQI